MGQMLKVGEGTPEFHLIMGKAYLQHQEYDAAFAELRKAEAADPNLPFVHFDLGIAYEETGKNEDGAQEFLKDLPRSIRTCRTITTNWGRFMAWRGGTREAAEQAYREALKRDPHRPGAWFGLAKIYQKQGKYEEALKAVRRDAEGGAGKRQGALSARAIAAETGTAEEAQAEFGQRAGNYWMQI